MKEHLCHAISCCRSFLLYWKPQFADEVLESGLPLRHLGSNQFKRLRPGDELWIVTSRRPTELSLAGHFLVRVCTDLETIRTEFPGDETWPARHQVVTDHPEGFKDVDITPIAQELRFQSKHDRLIILDGRIPAQQLQTMRQLSEASASILRRVWKQNKLRPRRISVLQNLLR